MFSQRNNPYCDLLKISNAKIKTVHIVRIFYKMISFYLQNGTTQVDYVVLSKYGIFAIETKKIVST